MAITLQQLLAQAVAQKNIPDIRDLLKIYDIIKEVSGSLKLDLDVEDERIISSARRLMTDQKSDTAVVKATKYDMADAKEIMVNGIRISAGKPLSLEKVFAIFLNSEIPQPQLLEAYILIRKISAKPEYIALGNPINLLTFAAYNLNLRVIKLVLSAAPHTEEEIKRGVHYALMGIKIYSEDAALPVISEFLQFKLCLDTHRDFKTGYTMLQIAVKNAYYKVLVVMIAHGVQIRVRVNKTDDVVANEDVGRETLELTNDWDILKALFTGIALQALKVRNIVDINFILEKHPMDVDLNFIDSEGNSIISLLQDFLEKTNLFLLRKSVLRTACVLMARANHADLVMKILETGMVNVNVSDAYDGSLPFYSALMGNPRLLGYLCTYKPNVATLHRVHLRSPDATPLQAVFTRLGPPRTDDDADQMVQSLIQAGVTEGFDGALIHAQSCGYKRTEARLRKHLEDAKKAAGIDEKGQSRSKISFVARDVKCSMLHTPLRIQVTLQSRLDCLLGHASLAQIDAVVVMDLLRDLIVTGKHNAHTAILLLLDKIKQDGIEGILLTADSNRKFVFEYLFNIKNKYINCDKIVMKIAGIIRNATEELMQAEEKIVGCVGSVLSTVADTKAVTSTFESAFYARLEESAGSVFSDPLNTQMSVDLGTVGQTTIVGQTDSALIDSHSSKPVYKLG